mgnify:CR=1 FL=1
MDRTEINNRYPIKELVEYKEHIESLASAKENSKGSDEVVFNDSVIHASLIMACILKNSRTINMFCGKFSVFRKAFEDKINTMLNDEFYDDIREKEIFKSFHPYQDSIGELKNFLQRGGQLTVILEENPLELQEEPIWNDVCQYVGRNLIFYKRNDNLGKLPHFAIGDDRYYRLENNQIERTALCAFDDKETVKTLGESFLTMKSESKKVDFN